jgi:hypothetical protein
VSGKFNLVDLDGKETQTGDTTLTVSVSDLSVPWSIPRGAADVEDPRFSLPTYEVGTMKIVRSFVSSKDKTDDTDVSADADKSAKADTTKSDSADTPELVRKDNLGKRDVLSFYNPATGMYEVVYDGHRSRWPYRNDMSWKTRNGSYGGWGLMSPMVTSTCYPSYAPMYGGGWGGGYNNGFAYGGMCGGFSAGLSLNFGWSSGCGYTNPYYCAPNRWLSGGSAVWNGYELVSINLVGSGVGYTTGGYYGGGYYDGSGGYKSSQAMESSVVETEEFVDLASAETKSSFSKNESVERESFIDLRSTKEMNGKTISDTNVGGSKNPSPSRTIEVLSTHNGAKPVTTQNNNTFTQTNNRFADVPSTRTVHTKEPLTVIRENRQGNNSGQGALNTKPGDNRKPVTTEGKPFHRNDNGRANVPSWTQTKPNRNQGGMNNASVYGNTKPSQRNSGNVNRGGGSKPQMQQRGSQRGGNPNVYAQPRAQQRSAPTMRPAPQQRQARPQMRQANPAQKHR